jgi:PAS domain S-box-containing protein
MLAQEVLPRTATRPLALALFAASTRKDRPRQSGRSHSRIGIDRDGHIDSVNAPAEKLLGWTSHDLVGKPVLALTGARTGQALADGSAVLRALQSGNRLRLERTLFRSRDGGFRPVACIATPRPDAGGLTLVFQLSGAGS